MIIVHSVIGLMSSNRFSNFFSLIFLGKSVLYHSKFIYIVDRLDCIFFFLAENLEVNCMMKKNVVCLIIWWVEKKYFVHV